MDSNSKSQNILGFLGIQENEDVINSSAKRQKICEDITMEETKDRISSLPNEILCHILSFLPTKYAVGTCILSTSWKYLWTSSLPINLDFDDELLLYRKGNNSRRRKMTLSFTSFVHRVLTLGNMSYMQRFNLNCGQNYKYSHVNAWICAALRRNVQELDLCIAMDDSRVIPHGLFTCGTLVSLKLDAELVLNVPSSFGLPKLKTLLLRKVIFLDDESMQMLFSSCPVLEELLMLECRCKTKVFNISGFSILKRLIFSHCIYKAHFEYKLIIDAPMLEYLELAPSMLTEDSSITNMESIIEAYLDIDFCYQKDCFEFIRAICNVKVLHLYGSEMRDFLSSHKELPMFPNVTRLEVGVEIAGQLLPDLLQNSPNLESLFFHGGLDPLATEEFHWSPPKQVPCCLLHCLKTIKIWEFHGLKEELKLVKYFLKNSNVLHLLKISTTGTVEMTDNKKLLMFPRRSKRCQVLLS